MKLDKVMDGYLAGKKIRLNWFATCTYFVLKDGKNKYRSINGELVDVKFSDQVGGEWEFVEEGCTHCNGTGKKPE